MVAAMRAQASGDGDAVRKRLRELGDRDPTDPIVAAYLADPIEPRATTPPPRVASDAATASQDPDRAAALRLEAAFERWREGDRVAAIEEMEAATPGAPEAARLALGWASWGVAPDSIDARRQALERAANDAAGDERRLALERFALEIGGGDADAARAALEAIERSPEGPLAIAAALGRLVWSGGGADDGALLDGLTRIEKSGPQGRLLAAIEHVQRAREGGDAERLARQASQWFEAGGGLPAALEWLAAAVTLGGPPRRAVRAPRHRAVAARRGLRGDPRERRARRRHARAGSGDAREAAARRRRASWNLELSPPASDPRRPRDGAPRGRRAARRGGGARRLGARGVGVPRAVEPRRRARGLSSAWPARGQATLAAWEGLRACAEAGGLAELRARAASELGARCQNAVRGAAFWEEAANVHLQLGDEAGAEHALGACFDRDPTRAGPFDKLFRRVRARKDNEALLALIRRRLEFTDEPAEIQKLFWEQARVLCAKKAATRRARSRRSST